MAAEKRFTRKEIEEDQSKDTVFIIDNVVYNVSKFLDEHPGGHEVLHNVSGKDATEDFNDIGHSLDAKDLMKKFRVGELVEADKVEVVKRTTSWSQDTKEETSFLSSWKFPLALGILVTVLYTYLFG